MLEWVVGEALKVLLRVVGCRGPGEEVEEYAGLRMDGSVITPVACQFMRLMRDSMPPGGT